MKKILFVLSLLSVVLVCAFSASAERITINEELFPDNAFRMFLHTYFGVPNVETDEVLELSMPEEGIADLTGIGNFTKLQSLTCYGNRLFALDLSLNCNLMGINASGQCPFADYVRLSDGGVSFAVGKGLTGYTFPDGSYDETTGFVTYTEDILSPSFTASTGREGLTLSGMLIRRGELIPIDSAHFPDDNFREYVKQFDTDTNGMLNPEECAAVKTISVNYYNIGTVKGVEYFPALQFLFCDNNPLTELDLSQNLALIELSCVNTGISSLDVTKHTALQKLYISNTKITELNLTNNHLLKRLDCENVKLSSLDVTKNTELTELHAANCGLTTLDLSNNANLLILDVASNALSQLDLKACTSLKSLNCSGTQLGAVRVYSGDKLQNLYCAGVGITSLNLDMFTSLGQLNCSGNGLSELDVSKNPQLFYLDCSNNELTALDLSANRNLVRFNCSENAIDVLDLEVNGALRELQCANNAMRALKLGSKPTLSLLECQHNELSELDLKNISTLSTLNCSYNCLSELDLKNISTLSTLNCSYNCLCCLVLNEEAPYNSLDCSNQKTDHRHPFWFDGETGHCLLTAGMEGAEFDDGVIYDKTTGIASFDASRTGFSYRVRFCSDLPAKLEVNILRGPDTPVSEIKLNCEVAVLMFSESTGGDTLRLSATVLPEMATYRDVTWSSGNESVATVAADGTVTAVFAGSTAITCTAADGSGVTAVCRVAVLCDHVIVPIPPTEPTCTETGNNAYYACRLCGQCFRTEDGSVETTPEAEIVPAKGHMPVDRVIIPATHRTKGYSGKVCERCNIILEIDKELPILKDVTLLILPSYVEQIGEEAFSGSAAECVILPKTCTRIEAAAFANCAALKFVEMSANVEWIAEDAFSGSPLEAIVAPAGSYAEGWAKAHHIPVATE